MPASSPAGIVAAGRQVSVWPVNGIPASLITPPAEVCHHADHSGRRDSRRRHDRGCPAHSAHWLVDLPATAGVAAAPARRKAGAGRCRCLGIPSSSGSSSMPMPSQRRGPEGDRDRRPRPVGGHGRCAICTHRSGPIDAGRFACGQLARCSASSLLVRPVSSRRNSM